MNKILIIIFIIFIIFCSVSESQQQIKRKRSTKGTPAFGGSYCVTQNECKTKTCIVNSIKSQVNIYPFKCIVCDLNVLNKNIVDKQSDDFLYQNYINTVHTCQDKPPTH